MRHRRVSDVMTDDVITVPVDMPFHGIARTLAEHKVSGVPVLDANRRVVGMVTEADLLNRQARTREPDNSLLWRLLRGSTRARRRRTGRTAADLMSRPVVTVEAEARLSTAAALMARNGVKRLPVVGAEGVLRGIVSRKDLLSVYLREDADLAAEIRTEVLVRAMSVPPSDVTVEVSQGVVTLRGKVERQSMIEIIAVLTAAVDGVVDVRTELTAETDDTHIPPPPPQNVGILQAWTRSH